MRRPYPVPVEAGRIHVPVARVDGEGFDGGEAAVGHCDWGTARLARALRLRLVAAEAFMRRALAEFKFLRMAHLMACMAIGLDSCMLDITTLA